MAITEKQVRVEHLVYLATDPHVMVDLAAPHCANHLHYWRAILVRELDGRPEGFTDGRALNGLAKIALPVEDSASAQLDQ